MDNEAAKWLESVSIGVIRDINTYLEKTLYELPSINTRNLDEVMGMIDRINQAQKLTRTLERSIWLLQVLLSKDGD